MLYLKHFIIMSISFIIMKIKCQNKDKLGGKFIRMPLYHLIFYSCFLIKYINQIVAGWFDTISKLSRKFVSILWHFVHQINGILWRYSDQTAKLQNICIVYLQWWLDKEDINQYGHEILNKFLPYKLFKLFFKCHQQ